MARLNFNLRRQLIMVSLLLLTLPWAGCRFIQEMESALGKGQEQTLTATAQTIAAMAAGQPELVYANTERIHAADDPRQGLYASRSLRPVIVDGYAEDWEDVPGFSWSSSLPAHSLNLEFKAVTRDDNLYLLVRVTDENVNYYNPGLPAQPNGDRLVLRTGLGNRSQDYILATAAPGSLTARMATPDTPGAEPERIWGYWQDARGGYTMELEVPLSLTGGRLGFYVVDGNGHGEPDIHLGNIVESDPAQPPWLIYTPKALPATLAPFAAQADSVHILDKQRWVIGELRENPSSARTPATFWLIRLVYRSILSDDNLPFPPATGRTGQRAPPAPVESTITSSSKRYRDPQNPDRTLRVVEVPINPGSGAIGSVVVSQSSEQYLSLTDHAFSRLLGYSALALFMGVFGLLAYASLLSLRIRKLSKAASSVIASDGSISGRFPRSSAPDEIGELSRHYAQLLGRLSDYNDYLRTLSSTLSHELRTPIAVIQTSLENLEETRLDERDHQRYLGRAREGLTRLTNILRDMSEASRLEESLQQNALDRMDLIPLLQALQQAYSGVYVDHSIELRVPSTPAEVIATPDLVVQLLDKLVDNAISFSAPGSPVTISLALDGRTWELAVTNTGPPLPDGMEGALFEPMVTSRSADNGSLHLGLGLHIARLISDYLNASISAQSTANPVGVRIAVRLAAQ